VISCEVRAFSNGTHQPAQEIEDLEPHSLPLIESERKHRSAVERIGVVLIQTDCAGEGSVPDICCQGVVEHRYARLTGHANHQIEPAVAVDISECQGGADIGRIVRPGRSLVKLAAAVQVDPKLSRRKLRCRKVGVAVTVNIPPGKILCAMILISVWHPRF